MYINFTSRTLQRILVIALSIATPLFWTMLDIITGDMVWPFPVQVIAVASSILGGFIIVCVLMAYIMELFS